MTSMFSSSISITVHGNWGQWSDYGACDTTCGFGNRKRTRKCNNPKPKNEGDFCVGTDSEIVSGCNPFPCPSMYCL